MNLEQAAMSIAKKHQVHENDARVALLLTRAHLRHSSRDRVDCAGTWEDEHSLLDDWFTNGTEWVAPDWSDARDSASWLLHRNVACTWAVNIAHQRSRRPE